MNSSGNETPNSCYGATFIPSLDPRSYNAPRSHVARPESTGIKLRTEGELPLILHNYHFHGSEYDVFEHIPLFLDSDYGTVLHRGIRFRVTGGT